MSGRTPSISDALDELVPPFDPPAPDDWDEIISRAIGTASSAPGDAGPASRRRRWRQRRYLVAAAATAAIAILIATPAFGIRSLILDLFDRTNVPFTGKTAPLEVKRNFFDLGLGLPAPDGPGAIASETRRVASFRAGGVTHILWVAPTRDGGFCWTFSHGLTGCLSQADRLPRTSAHPPARGAHPQLLGVSDRSATTTGVQHVTEIDGELLAPSAYSLTVRYADGKQTPVRFYYVSKPIDAGFFYAGIPAGHDTTKTRATAVELRDKAGRLLARQPFSYQTPAQLAKERAREQAVEQALQQRRRTHHRTPPPVRRSPPLPPPTAPLQRGQAGGVTVIAGHNGVVIFDTSGATPAVRRLIAGRQVGYSCFGPLPYHTSPVGIGDARTTLPRVAIRVNDLHPPYLGCDIEGGYGHTWPDRLHGHSAVEIALTPAGASFFANRAAARDLALFVRSKAIHAIRKLSGGALDQAIRDRYGSAITKLSSAGAVLPAGRIGYASSGDTTTFVEQSTTGHRFYVRVTDGKIIKQNVKPLALVF